LDGLAVLALPFVVCVLTTAAMLQQEQQDGDGDGIPDSQDQCPGEPETVNGFSDQDGCPDSFETLIDLGVQVVDEFWQVAMPELGARYTPPAEWVTYVSPVRTGCGPTVENNAMYCPMDRSLYFDRNFLRSEFEGGDFAPVLIMAHEWGHLAQHQLGIFTSARYNIQHELQADCFAGAFARHANDVQKILEPGDLNEALSILFRLGNPDVPWLDPQAHGSPGDRIDAFHYGFRRSVKGCAGAEFAETGGGIFKVFPPEGRPEGSLRTALPQRVGQYELVAVQPFPALIQEGATDALLATYHSREGVQVGHMLAAFPSSSECSRGFSAILTALQQEEGYAVVGQEPLTDREGRPVGQVAQLRGDNEIVLLMIQQLLLVASGPEGHPTSFLESYFAASPFK
jgi:predicted metalloprotease